MEPRRATALEKFPFDSQVTQDAFLPTIRLCFIIARA